MAFNILPVVRPLILLLVEKYFIFPRIVFVITYFNLILLFCTRIFPLRGRGSTFKWVLVIAIITQANESWRYISIFVDFTLRLYKKGEPYGIVLFNQKVSVPTLNVEVFKVIATILVGFLPWIVCYIAEKRQQRYRVTWLDIRRRYRNEIGSARYYLTRPLTPSEPNIGTTMKKCRSAEVLPRTIKPLPKVPRTA